MNQNNFNNSAIEYLKSLSKQAVEEMVIVISILTKTYPLAGSKAIALG